MTWPSNVAVFGRAARRLTVPRPRTIRMAAVATRPTASGAPIQREVPGPIAISTGTAVSPSVIPARLNIIPGSGPLVPRPPVDCGVTCRQVPENDDQISLGGSRVSAGGPEAGRDRDDEQQAHRPDPGPLPADPEASALL